ncbi:MAG: lysogenization protein HflD [Aestuariibacter sp.]
MKHTTMVNNDSQLISLAGIMQAAALIDLVAFNHAYPEDCFDACLSSVLNTHPAHTLDTFGGRESNLRLGYRTLFTQFSNEVKLRNVNVSRYLQNFIQAEKALRKKEAQNAELSKALGRIASQRQFSEIQSTQLITNMATVYDLHITQIKSPVIVDGPKEVLKRDYIRNKIKALSLAGLRACVLWRQVGGRQIHFVTGRRKIAFMAKQRLDLLALNNDGE